MTMQTCLFCFLQWSGNHNCTHAHIPTTYNHHNHTRYVEGCFRCDLSREEAAHAV